MKITTVSVHMARKVSKNFNSYDNSVGLTAELAEGEEHQQAVARLQKEIFGMLITTDPFHDLAKRWAAKKQQAGPPEEETTE